MSTVNAKKELLEANESDASSDEGIEIDYARSRDDRDLILYLQYKSNVLKFDPQSNPILVVDKQRSIDRTKFTVSLYRSPL